MKIKFNYTLLIMFALLLAIIAVYVVYYRYYYPNESTYNAYLNVFEELDSSIGTINISSINHRVEIKESNNDKVKIAYYQKLENSNKYLVSPTALSLKIQEEVEDLNNIFFKTENKIDVITIYLPVDKNIVINIESVYGDINVDNVDITNLVFENVSGDMTINNSNIKTLSLQTNSGHIEITGSEFDQLKLNSTSGRININLNQTIDLYNCNLQTEFGSIVLNNEIYKEEVEDGSLVASKKYLTNIPDAIKQITITTIRSGINVNYPIENKTINQED